MPKIDNEKFYKSAIKIHGETARGVHWNSLLHQEIRFDTIVSLLPQKLSSYTLVDAGCGFGDFYSYLQKTNLTPKEYIGIDVLQKMCNIASKKTEKKIIYADICKDDLPESDYYICSGALNILTSFETHQFIQNCYKSCKIGFVFNMLHGNKKSDTYNYMNTQQINTLAQNLGVKKLLFRDDYLDNDLTVGFFK